MNREKVNVAFDRFVRSHNAEQRWRDMARRARDSIKYLNEEEFAEYARLTERFLQQHPYEYHTDPMDVGK